jgi:hypothetical protein
MKAYIVNISSSSRDEKTFIQIFGRLENGKSFATEIEFTPYFYITEKDLNKAKNVLDSTTIEKTELKRIDSEIEILTIDRKELFEKYSEKIDVKTLKQAMRVQAIRDKVSRKDTFDTFVSILEGDL